MPCAARIERILAGLLIISAACAAAVLAHVAIDLVGDVLLVRDAYDNEDHASRLITFTVALAGGLAIIWHCVANAVAQARGGQRLLRSAVEGIVAGRAWCFIAQVTVLSIVVLALMGFVDARLDAQTIDGIGDLFGGSSAVGLSVSLMTGVAVGAAVLRIARAAAISHRKLVAAIAACFLLVRARRAAIYARRRDRGVIFHWRAGALARRAGKRAPPPALTE